MCQLNGPKMGCYNYDHTDFKTSNPEAELNGMFHLMPLFHCLNRINGFDFCQIFYAE